MWLILYLIGIIKSSRKIYGAPRQSRYSGYALILAFGKTPRDLNVKGEMELNGRVVSYCAVCDGPFFKNKKVAK